MPMTKRHIDWKTQCMKVSLAVETISMSVAKSIELMSNQGSQFVDSAGTVEFLKRFNKIFDIFNSDMDMSENIYKTPINADTKSSIFAFLDDMIVYIDGLTINGKMATRSPRYTAFKGFKLNAVALKLMYEELVESKMIDKLRTVSLQQDYLESFFGRIRSAGGSNSNPTQEQFVASFRKILINSELTCSTLANCVDKLNILNVSSGQAPISQDDKNFIMFSNWGENTENNLYDDQTEEEFLEAEGIAESNNASVTVVENQNGEAVDQTSDAENSLAETIGIANVAGLIEARIEKNCKFDCEICSTIFEENEKIAATIFVKNRKNVLPCKSTFDICKMSNKLTTSYFERIHESHFDYKQLFHSIKSKVTHEHLFEQTDFQHEIEHRTFIIDLIIEEFIRIRAVERARQITLSQHTVLLRSVKTHDIHFSGQ